MTIFAKIILLFMLFSFIIVLPAYIFLQLSKNEQSMFLTNQKINSSIYEITKRKLLANSNEGKIISKLHWIYGGIFFVISVLSYVLIAGGAKNSKDTSSMLLLLSGIVVLLLLIYLVDYGKQNNKKLGSILISKHAEKIQVVIAISIFSLPFAIIILMYNNFTFKDFSDFCWSIFSFITEDYNPIILSIFSIGIPIFYTIYSNQANFNQKTLQIYNPRFENFEMNIHKVYDNIEHTKDTIEFLSNNKSKYIIPLNDTLLSNFSKNKVNISLIKTTLTFDVSVSNNDKFIYNITPCSFVKDTLQNEELRRYPINEQIKIQILLFLDSKTQSKRVILPINFFSENLTSYTVDLYFEIKKVTENKYSITQLNLQSLEMSKRYIPIYFSNLETLLKPRPTFLAWKKICDKEYKIKFAFANVVLPNLVLLLLLIMFFISTIAVIFVL